MTRALIARLFAGVAAVAVALVVVFAALHALPGGAAALADDPSLTSEARARLVATLGLDRPAWRQGLDYALRLAHGDLGTSIARQQPVTAVLVAAAGPTLLLAGAGLLVAFALGVPLGVRAAARPRGLAAAAVRVALPLLDAAPPFWLGLLAVTLFAWKLGWLPAAHLRAAEGAGKTWGPAPLDLLAHLLLPALVIGLPGAAPVARTTCAATAARLAGADARAARALGVPEARIVRRAARGALQPAIALAGLALPALAGGAAVVEVVFAWPGLGTTQQQALLARDVPLALGGLALYGLLVVAGGMAADLLAAWADPRLRESAR